MAISLVFSFVGAVIAAVGSGVLLARCFRGPRGDLIAWSVALLGLLVSLGSQTLGYMVGFDSALFRAMELGGQVIAPLAVALGLSEVAAKSMGARFCARLYIPSLALVASVVLLLDQLAPKGFNKTWPDPAVYYQTPPDYVLMFAVGPATAIVALIAVYLVTRRSSEPGWNAILRPQLLAGGAALLLAYPPLTQLAAYEAHVHLPVHREFSLILALAAALTWLAGARFGELRPEALRGSAVRRGTSSRWDEASPRDAAGPRDAASPRDGGGGLHRSDDVLPAADFATGDFVAGDFGAGDHAQHAADGWHAHHDHEEPDEEQPYGGGWRNDGNRELDIRHGDSSRAQLFGQIAIYTLLEDAVNEFDQLTEHVVDLVRSQEPDTLVYIVHAVPSAPLQRILYEVYRDRHAYERHGQQSYVRQFEADQRPYVLATNVIELGLQQAKVSPFPSVAELFGEPGHDTSGFQRPDYLRDYGRPSSREYR